MKFIELEIKYVRGIKDIILRPNGKNFVVWGLNGSGKSAVVDAVDFLLTGRITRLMGQGTANISLQKHGAHVDCADPKAAYVKALIEINGSSEHIEIRRSMGKPGALICPKDKAKKLEPILEIAQRGQHVLTRRELLKFITAEGGKRAKEIQSLMNLSEIEDIRLALVKVSNKLERKLDEARGRLSTATGAVNAVIQLEEYNEDLILNNVNKNRGLLSGKPLIRLQPRLIMSEIKPPAVIASDKDVNTTVFEKDISNLLTVLDEEKQRECKENDAALRGMVSALHEDAQLLNSFSNRKLTLQGLNLIDGVGRCPLCDTPWDPNELKLHLLDKLETAKDVDDRIKTLTSYSTSLQVRVSTILRSLENVIETTNYIDLKDDEVELVSWKNRLEQFESFLDEPVGKYHNPPFSQEEVGRLFATDSLSNTLATILQCVKSKFPESTPEQTAWDILNKLEGPLLALEECQKGFEEAHLSHQRAELLKLEFMRARDQVLGKLYNDIKNRFVELYRELHYEDESDFDASITPQEASLEFEVDFFGRGNHPPHALHSEGHQDSMGLCLFLALSEELTENFIDLIILDDVVMSVDSEHRREVCNLLSNHFKERQFLITTHDRVWAHQLRSEGVVESSEAIEFFDWNLETGPKINEAVDIWPQIELDLAKGDVNAASARLRRGSEQFFAEACDNLHSLVEYRLNGRYELGDYLSAAMSKFKELLKSAKVAARSWEDTEDTKDEIEILDQDRKDIYTKLGEEQWAVNVNVHYNDWADFGPSDFKPVVDAFKNLFDLFLCKRCNSMLRLILDGKEPQNVRCNCGAVNWNLVKRKNA